MFVSEIPFHQSVCYSDSSRPPKICSEHIRFRDNKSASHFTASCSILDEDTEPGLGNGVDIV